MENDKKEHLKYVWEQVNQWLSFAEAKNAALIVFNIAVLGVLKDLFSKNDIQRNIVIVFILASIALALLSFLPTLIFMANNKRSYFDNPNLLFFMDISNIKNSEEYLNLSNNRYFKDENYKPSELERDLADEILINSKITKEKYCLFRCAAILDLIAILLTFILLIHNMICK